MNLHGLHYTESQTIGKCWELGDREGALLWAHWEKEKTSLTELQEQFQQLPRLTAGVESMTANLTHSAASFEEVEKHLLNLQDLCERCEWGHCKHMVVLCLIFWGSSSLHSFPPRVNRVLFSLHSCNHLLSILLLDIHMNKRKSLSLIDICIIMLFAILFTSQRHGNNLNINQQMNG